MRRVKKISQRQEVRVARRLGGRPLPASGAVKHGGYDLRKVGELTAECKYTSKGSYTLKLADIKKLKAAALINGAEMPVFVISFTDASGVPIEELAVVPLTYLEQKLHAIGWDDDDEDEDDEDDEDDDDDDEDDEDDEEDDDEFGATPHAVPAPA